MLKFHNTLTNQLEAFKPLDPPRVRMYCCGPTVHDYAHIGNYRTFMFVDILNRFLRYRDYDLLFVMNITDMDDKTIQKSAAAGLSLGDFTSRYAEAFLEDLDTLRIRRADIICRATEHIDEMVDLVRALDDKGHTYDSDGSVYYKIATFDDYGKLSKKDFSGIRAGARVDSDEYEKEDARDFVLWKGRRGDEPYWDTPFGPGRPGWHLECSAMSMKYCGETLDIHCGGADLVFPHHENEIAQSEGATGKPFVRTWLHCEYLIVNGEKMSKSKGNFFTLRDLLDKGYDPRAVRYLLLSTHYRKQLNFTEEGLGQAQAALDRIFDFVDTLERKSLADGETEAVTALCEAARERFEAALDDDLNTSAALAALFDFIRDVNRRLAADEVRAGDRERILAAFRRMDSVLDLMPAASAADGDEAIEALVREREAARKNRDWARADAIRDQLQSMGVVIKDTPEGTVWRKA